MTGAYLAELLASLPPSATVRTVVGRDGRSHLSVQMRPGAAADAMRDAAAQVISRDNASERTTVRL